MLKLLGSIPLLGWLGLVGCLWFTGREIFSRSLPRWRLAVIPACASLAALSAFGPSKLVGTALFVPWLMAILAGAGAGVVAGRYAKLRVDHQWNVVRLRGAWTGFAIAVAMLGLFVATGMQIKSGASPPWSLALVIGVALGSGFYIGRALMFMHRSGREPHSDLVGAYSLGSM